MLPTSEAEVCLSCHGNEADRNRRIATNDIASDASPPLLETALSQTYLHPLNRKAVVSGKSNEVVCTSCHSPHRRSLRGQNRSQPNGKVRLSPRDPSQQEYELCQSCHGKKGIAADALGDISRLLTPENASFHPVHAPARTLSPSVKSRISGRRVNCTDCHGNASKRGARGPHGSTVASILRWNYQTADGATEAPETYTLCYECHNRKAIFSSSPFPLHSSHVIQDKTSCATCHAPHGSIGNRALIRFGEETKLSGVKPSSSGRLAFISPRQGSGACYLICHDVDHNPLGYGLTLGILPPAPTSMGDMVPLRPPGIRPGVDRPGWPDPPKPIGKPIKQ